MSLGVNAIRTGEGPAEGRHRHLPAFFAVQAATLDQRKVSARTIQRVLQVVGAAHYAARGDADKIEAMLLALLDGGCITPAGLLDKARKEAAWGAVLCRAQLSAEAERARILRQLRASLDREPWPRAELEAVHAEIAYELAPQRDSHPREVPTPAKGRWAPPSRSDRERGGTLGFASGVPKGVRTGTA